MSDMVQSKVVQYELLQEFFNPGPICSDLVQVELDPNKTVQVDLEHRARFPIPNTLTEFHPMTSSILGRSLSSLRDLAEFNRRQ